jgi:hypothetical protein
MSIATLKKKTQTKYNNMSVGSKTGFSLNGTLRNQGYVGQTSLSRSLPKTMMKGNVKRGHGGCCGTYDNAPIVQSAVISLNDPTVIKKSVLNTSGMIESKYMWTKRPFPYAVVKPDNNNNINNASNYITNLSKTTIQSVNSCNKILPTIQPKTQCANYDAYFKTNNCAYTKPESDYVAMSQGEYVINTNNACVDNDVKNVIKNTYRTPFAGGNTV